MKLNPFRKPRRGFSLYRGDLKPYCNKVNHITSIRQLNYSYKKDKYNNLIPFWFKWSIIYEEIGNGWRKVMAMIHSLRTKLTMLGQIFWVFCRIGPASFGGGYAMIPVIEREVVDRRQWMKREEMNELVSVAGSAPGGVGVNAAAFIGYRMGGVMGACMAVLGITMPTFSIVILLSWLYQYLDGNVKWAAALKGIHASIIALILLAAYRMAKASLFDKSTKVISLVAVALLIFTPVPPLYLIIGGILAGVISVAVKEKLGMKTATEKEKEPGEARELTFPEYYI